MITKKKNLYKPLYKQFIRLRDNVQERKKILKFKRNKWTRFVELYKKKLKRYQKFKPQDPTRYIVSKFPTKGASYKKKFRDSLVYSKKLKLFYGGVSRKLVKKNTNLAVKNNKKNLNNIYIKFLQTFETRLDTILYRSKFVTSMRRSKQLILHGKVFVNKSKTITPSLKLKPGDLVQIDPNSYNLIEKNIKETSIWSIPPKYLTINYKTMEILVGNIEYTNLSLNFPFNLNLEQILVNYCKS